MSEYIPFEIQIEIIKKLPVKSLIQFRSVSKQWKSLIDSTEFITDHSLNQTQPNHLLVSYEYKYISFVDDNTFPHHTFSPTASINVRLGTILDSSHGLVCLYHSNEGNYLFLLWNPSIDKTVEIVLPNRLQVKDIGFGVCRKTSDPKILVVDKDLKVEVFALSSRAWRTISVNLSVPLRSLKFKCNQAVIDGVIYWVAYCASRYCYMIVSFDLTSEEFGEIELPACLSNPYISKVKGSLAVLDYDKWSIRCDVLMVSKNGDDPKSLLTKLFTVSFTGLLDSLSYPKISGFLKNGQPIIEHLCEHDGLLLPTLELYEPFMEDGSGLGTGSRFMMTSFDTHFQTVSYTESLLLLNYSDS